MASRSIKNRPSVKKKHPFTGVLIVITVFAAVIAAGVVGVCALGSSWIGDLRDYDVAQIEELNISYPSEVYASDGTTKLARLQLENREPLPSLDLISPYVIKGTVATEDERFYEHEGVDLVGIARAAVVTLTGSGREGASTITQQLVRNTVLSDEMNDISLKRKVREMYLAVKIEEMFSKDKILLMYLNTINYGNGTYGIQAAAQRYYSKDALDLTLAESAALVGIPQSPTYNEPLNYADNCLARRNVVLSRMVSNNCITQEECESAQAEDLALNETAPTNDGILAYPFFTSYVINTLQKTYSQAEIFAGGLQVITTLDVDMQQAAEDAIATKEQTLPDAISGSLVAIEPDTGYVKALVGGKDYYANQTNLATGQGTNGGRPCGSTFKTFTLIAALEAGIDPRTMVDCSSPATLPEAGYPADNPLNNIDNLNFGTINIQRAFAKSSNTGFVRLQMSVGVDKVKEVAERMGITSPLAGIGSLTLGTQNVTMLDMACAYASIANGGVKYPVQAILEVRNHDGKLIVDNSVPSGERVISPEVARAATDVMKTVVTDFDGTGGAARLMNGQEVAAKTGTGTEYKDITFCGITPQMSVAIWFGDLSNEQQLPAHVGADDVFAHFMNRVLDGQPVLKFPDAKTPKYLPSYSDSKYHIGGASDAGKSKSDSENSKDKKKDKTEMQPSASANDANGTNDASNENNAGNASSGGSDENADGNAGGGNSAGQGGSDGGASDSSDGKNTPRKRNDG